MAHNDGNWPSWTGPLTGILALMLWELSRIANALFVLAGVK